MAKQREKKQRKPKVFKGQTIAARRQADRRQREANRPAERSRRDRRRQYRFRVKVIRYYSKLRDQVPAKRALELTLAKYQPREPWHQPLSASTIRRWYRPVQKEGYAALMPRSTRPQTITYQVPDLLVEVIFTLRYLLGWGGHRIAAELKARQIGSVAGRTVYKVFDRLHLPVKVYALKSRSDGIAYRRYERKRPNAQWHIDLKHLTLADGSKVYICIIIDDYSRYALAAVVGREATTEWVTRVTEAAIRRAGRPTELVSDNGREFVSVWEDTLTKFGQLLQEQGVTHRTSAPYYPQGNGKAEAFIKLLDQELLQKHTFVTLAEVQEALDRYLTFYNNYRLHSGLGWQPPVTRYTGCAVAVRGLAGIPGLESMAAHPRWGPSSCDSPVEITPTTAQNARAVVPLPTRSDRLAA